MIGEPEGPRAAAGAGAHSPRLPRWKRAFDLAFCAMALPLLAVATLFVAIMMKLGSPGPVFFRQERVGYRGRRFMCYKFRTMKVGASIALHQALCDQLIHSHAPMVKMDARGDPRLIPGAWLLRASGLDELPQIINVLRGEMSVVGPRPCVPYEYDQYLPWQRARFAAVPGLSGLWQVSGKNRTTFEEMIRLDLRYVRTMTMWLDLKILFMTIPALVRQIREVHMARGSRAGDRPAVLPGFRKPVDLTVVERSRLRRATPHVTGGGSGVGWDPCPAPRGHPSSTTVIAGRSGFLPPFHANSNRSVVASVSPTAMNIQKISALVALGGALGLGGGCATGPESRVVSTPPPPAPTTAAGTVPARQQSAAATVVVPGAANTYVVLNAPPAPQPEAVPPRPSDQHLWIPGYWTWQNGNYAWMAGHWEMKPSANAVWINPTWEPEGNAFGFMRVTGGIETARRPCGLPRDGFRRACGSDTR